MLEGDFIAFLKANVISLEGRVHLGNIPQDSPLPAAAVIRISGSTPRTLGNRALFSRADVKVVTVGDASYSPTIAAANELREKLDGYKGSMGDTYVESCRCIAEPADTSFVDGTKVMRQLEQDFKVVYRP